MTKQAVAYFSALARLRPEFLWFGAMLVLYLVLIATVSWNRSREFLTEDMIMEEMHLVKLTLQKEQAPPQVTVADNLTPDVKPVEEEYKEFGQKDGEFQDITDTAIAPRPLFRNLPPYPYAMRKYGTEGTVVIELYINERGDVVYGKIVRSLGREFDKSVILWAQGIRFTPAMTPARKPFACVIRVPIRFKLDS